MVWPIAKIALFYVTVEIGIEPGTVGWGSTHYPLEHGYTPNLYVD